jgi:4a-hydroxytetrahydrobiopterin dehydratase
MKDNDENSQELRYFRQEEGRLKAELKFHDFKTAFSFMKMMADFSEEIDHHPDWRNVWNRVEIELFTHEASAITQKDFRWAARAEEIFSEKFLRDTLGEALGEKESV